MADEITQNPAADTAGVAPIASAPEKKKRAPRTPKVAPTTAPVAAATTGRGRKSAIPFGPFLTAGALVAVFWGERIADWYLRSFP